MTSQAYTISIIDRLLNHTPLASIPAVVHDGSVYSKEELLAQVASNDYFATLATSLDQISQNLEDCQHSDYIVLEKLINDLLYLQQHYKIIKR